MACLDSWDPNFRLNGETIFAHDSIGALEFAIGYRYKPQCVFFIVLWEAPISEMSSVLVGVAGVPTMGAGRRRGNPPPKRGASMRSRRGAPGETRRCDLGVGFQTLVNHKDTLPYYSNLTENIPIITMWR